MPTNLEMRVIQKTSLYKLLKFKSANSEVTGIIGLDELIKETKVAMEAEDIAFVEKIIAET